MRPLVRASSLAALLGLLAFSVPADAGWTQAGTGQSGTGGITLPAGDLSGTGSTNTTPTISNVTGTGTSGSETVSFGPSGTPYATLAQGTVPVLGTAGTILSVPTNTNFGFVTTGGGQYVFSSASNIYFQTTELLIYSSTQVLGVFFVPGTGVWTWGAAQTTPGWNQQQSTSGAGVAMLYQAQAAKTGSAANGGDITIASGLHDGVGIDGAIHISDANVVDDTTFKPWTGTVNTQGRGDIQQNATVRTTTLTASTGLTIPVPTTQCVQATVTWSAASATRASYASNTTQCSGCNVAGTVTAVGPTNVLAANQTIGAAAVCGVANTAVLVCLASSTNLLIQVQCTGTGGPLTVDWQLESAINVN